MNRNILRLLALTLTVTSLLGACTLIAEVDRSKIADESGDPSGDGDGDVGGGGAGGNGGAGGAGGASN